MNFELADEQRMLKESAAKYLRERYSFDARREMAASHEPFSGAHWRQFAELGWLSVPVSAERGGYGADPVDIASLFELFGRYLVLEPFLETALIAGFWLEYLPGDGSELLQEMMAGELQFAFAHREPPCLGQAPVGETRVVRRGADIILTGRKCVVANAPVADYLIVSALEGPKLQLFLVPADAHGVQRHSYATHDGRTAADITLTDVALSSEATLHTGDARATLATLDDRIRLAVAAELLGIADALVEQTVAYAKEREQFGQPIGRFQVLQHRMVDMYMKTETLRSIVLAAASLMCEGSDEARRAVAAARIRAEQVGRSVAHSAIQIHGGIATTDEMPVGHYFKRLTVIANQFQGIEGELRRFGELDAPRHAFKRETVGV